jgi:hypothetical protein
MSTFPKKSKPKKLSLPEMWKLYSLLKPVLREKKEELAIDEVIFMMENIDTVSFKSSLKLMYGEKISYLEKTPLEIGQMFSEGIYENKLFEFQDLIRKLS